MRKTKDKIEKLYRIPCGAIDVSADSVCRRSLKESYDKLLDRLTREIHPVDVIEDSQKGSEPEPESIKEKLIREGKLRAEVKLAIKKYEEELQGNSKLLQDVSGKIEPW